jgi:hypothetical protein
LHNLGISKNKQEGNILDALPREIRSYIFEYVIEDKSNIAKAIIHKKDFGDRFIRAVQSHDIDLVEVYLKKMQAPDFDKFKKVALNIAKRSNDSEIIDMLKASISKQACNIL